MKTAEYLKQVVLELRKEQEEYSRELKVYEAYKNLHWVKKFFAKKVSKPRFSAFRQITLLSNYWMTVCCYIYFHENIAEISVALNEKGHGYKIDIFTLEKESLIGSKGTDVSVQAETVALNFCHNIAELLK